MQLRAQLVLLFALVAVQLCAAAHLAGGRPKRALDGLEGGGFGFDKKKRALDVLDGQGFGFDKRALNSIEGNGFGFDKRALNSLEGEGFGFDKKKRALDGIDGEGFGFDKRALNSIEGEGFGFDKRALNSLEGEGFGFDKRALNSLEGEGFGFDKRALNSIEGNGFGFDKRALNGIEGNGFGFDKRALNSLEGEGFGFDKRALNSIEGNGFGFDKRQIPFYKSRAPYLPTVGDLCEKIISAFHIDLRNIAYKYVSSQTPSEQFKMNGIIPDMLPSGLTTMDRLEVDYRNGTMVEFGNELTPTQVKNAPTVSWKSENGSLYTLIFTDPDAPSRANPVVRETKHWLVVNIPDNRVDDGDIVAGYIGSGPPADAGLHRYVFMLFKQPKRMKVTESVPSNSTKDRASFKTVKYAAVNLLEGPIAGNFFQARYDKWVDELVKTLTMKDIM